MIESCKMVIREFRSLIAAQFLHVKQKYLTLKRLKFNYTKYIYIWNIKIQDDADHSHVTEHVHSKEVAADDCV